MNPFDGLITIIKGVPNKINFNPPMTLLETVSVSGQIYLKIWLTNYPSITKEIPFHAKVNNQPCEITWTSLIKPTKIMFIGDLPS
jgi:hypothetical protein